MNIVLCAVVLLFFIKYDQVNKPSCRECIRSRRSGVKQTP
jgi:hypothetical protein